MLGPFQAQQVWVRLEPVLPSGLRLFWDYGEEWDQEWGRGQGGTPGLWVTHRTRLREGMSAPTPLLLPRAQVLLQPQLCPRLGVTPRCCEDCAAPLTPPAARQPGVVQLSPAVSWLCGIRPCRPGN